MVRTLAHAHFAAAVAAGLGIVFTAGAGRSQAEPDCGERTAAVEMTADETVQEALQREIYGLASDRDRLLRAAAEQSPQCASAQWHLGNVLDSRRRWISMDEFIEHWVASRKVKLYESARNQATDTVEGQLALADYCRREKLPEQMRAALARVLDHDPNHAAAREALGFVRAGPLWLSREEVAADEAQSRAWDASIAKWRRDLSEIARDLASDKPNRRAQSVERLRKIVDVSAIPALERIISPVSDEAARAVLEILQAMPDAEASLSLARHAVMHPSLPVREAASLALAGRDLHSFAPALVNLMITPVESRAAVAPLPGGRIGFRQVFVRESIDRQDVLLMDTEYERISGGGSEESARRRAAGDIAGSARRRLERSERESEATLRLNERIAWVLNRATQHSLPASPESWWQWWNDQNERLPAEQKTMAVSQVYRQVQISDPVPLTGIGSALQGGGGGGECLVAGTLVCTASGPKAIEKIQRGDLVLSQDADSGELTFKPVLRTTTRPRGKIVKFTAGHETFECSGGHVFWIAGDGWKKASELESGMLLHTACGPLPIASVETGNDAETFNLVVADFATYFVGQQKILSHDFTLRTATTALVPGLKPQ